MIDNLIGNWRKSGWISPPGKIYYLSHCSFQISLSQSIFIGNYFHFFVLGTADKRYQTKRHEHVANIITFLIGVLYAFYMLKFALFDVYNVSRYVLIFVYAFTFLAMVTFSTLFHFIDFFKWKSLMKYFKVKILSHSFSLLTNFRFCTFWTAVVYIYLFVAVTRPGCSLRIFIIFRSSGSGEFSEAYSVGFIMNNIRLDQFYRICSLESEKIAKIL